MNISMSDGAKASLKKVVDKFMTGDLSPIVEVVTFRLEKSEVFPASLWTMTNQVLAFMQSGDLDCRGFRQWQEVGRQVKKGARASYILGPIVKKDEDNPDEVKVVGFRTIAVFGYSQTEGDELVQVDRTPAKLPELYEVAERLGVKVTYMPMVQTGAYGWFQDGLNKQIVLGTAHDSVFYHELAHAAHATFEKKTKKGQDPYRETVAELSAAVLMQLYGCDWTGNAWKYIASYANDPVVAIQRALSTVEKVLQIIFEKELADENSAVLQV